MSGELGSPYQRVGRELGRLDRWVGFARLSSADVEEHRRRRGAQSGLHLTHAYKPDKRNAPSKISLHRATCGYEVWSRSSQDYRKIVTRWNGRWGTGFRSLHMICHFDLHKFRRQWDWSRVLVDDVSDRVSKGQLYVRVGPDGDIKSRSMGHSVGLSTAALSSIGFLAIGRNSGVGELDNTGVATAVGQLIGSSSEKVSFEGYAPEFSVRDGESPPLGGAREAVSGASGTTVGETALLNERGR